jgi:hypothetical protein
MDYGYRLNNGQTCDLNYMRYVGWSENNDCIKSFFSPQTIALISKKVTELTRGVDKFNRSIIVPDERICEVMSSVYWAYRPATGDIYSRYIIPTREQDNAVQSLIDQTIEIITSNIRNQLGMEQNNEMLSAWIQVYGDFNAGGLRQHSQIKVLGKRPATMQFNMNY